MTDHTNTLERVFGESSRRSFMKKGAVASGGLALGLSGFGGAAAQDGDGSRGVMLNSQFSGGARFTVASEPLGWAPIESEFQGTQYDTRVINYAFSQGAYAMLFVPQDADVQQGETYEFDTGLDGVEVDEGVLDTDLVFDDPGELGLVGVQFSPVQQGTTPAEDGAGNETADTETTTTETGG